MNPIDRPARVGLITDQTGALSFMGIANVNLTKMIIDDIKVWTTAIISGTQVGLERILCGRRHGRRDGQLVGLPLEEYGVDCSRGRSVRTRTRSAATMAASSIW